MTLRTMCGLDEGLGGEVKAQWLHVLRGLCSLAVVNPGRVVLFSRLQTPLEVWNDLGTQLGLDENAVRSEDAIVIKKASRKPLNGCSWLKCPRYQDSSTVEPLMACCGCRVVSPAPNLSL